MGIEEIFRLAFSEGGITLLVVTSLGFFIPFQMKGHKAERSENWDNLKEISNKSLDIIKENTAVQTELKTLISELMRKN